MDVLRIIIHFPLTVSLHEADNSLLCVECIYTGRVSWFVMEIVSPIMFTYNLLQSPLSTSATHVSLSWPQKLLAGLYLIHYTNRAIISPLRTPSRSKSHIVVPLAGIMFNVLNGSLMGTYLSSPAATRYLSNAFSSPLFFVGVFLWTVGFIGNVWHDEVLASIRHDNNKEKKSDEKKSREQHYAIPYGGLYSYISFPNYLCEWVEWLGFALAASPLPITQALSVASLEAFFTAPSSVWAPRLTPPWVFLVNEFVLMFPRAYNGQKWYKKTFGEKFPKDRKIILPFIL